MKTYKIHLIRAGVCRGQVQGKYIGRTDEELTPASRRELKALAQRFEYPAAEAVVAPPLLRCTESAKILFPSREPAPMDGFSEFDFGEFEGLTAQELSGYKEFAEFLSGDEESGAPHGETNGEFKNRVADSFVRLAAGAMKAGMTEIALVATGGVIGTIMSLFAVPEAELSFWRAKPGHGWTLNLIPSVWTNTAKAEVWDTIPEPTARDYDEEFAGEDEGDKDFDPEEFRGFYTPED